MRSGITKEERQKRGRAGAKIFPRNREEFHNFRQNYSPFFIDLYLYTIEKNTINSYRKNYLSNSSNPICPPYSEIPENRPLDEWELLTFGPKIRPALTAYTWLPNPTKNEEIKPITHLLWILSKQQMVIVIFRRNPSEIGENKSPPIFKNLVPKIKLNANVT